uniref:cell wall / vacuolar inhibitor of fructosidase 2-like n=1 Tax=Fragaria vesca subsp. vesca TaxID=101020 RepID=UPI0005C81D84|nr:PREDICTED: cell wall / vacuolar inhibitor of fructosidase 2-like [Fragaria vesca subsp. vesca]
MGSTTILSLLLPLSLCFLFNQFSYVAGENPLIQKICHATPYYDLCISTLQSDKTSEKSDTEGLVAIVVKQAEATASSTYTYISKQMLTNGTMFGSAGELCESHYETTRLTLQESANDLGNDSFDSAGRKASEAREQAKTCGSDFARFSVTYPPDLAKRETLLKQLCDIASNIISSLLV